MCIEAHIPTNIIEAIGNQKQVKILKAAREKRINYMLRVSNVCITANDSLMHKSSSC